MMSLFLMPGNGNLQIILQAILQILFGAKKNNFRIGQTKSGDYISIPLSMPSSAVKDMYVSMYDSFMDSYVCMFSPTS